MTDRAYLFSLEHLGIKLGLEQIRGLLTALGHPDRAYPCVLIAGTNGKGSVAAMVERGLRAAGYRTGRYTSPHLVRLEERFALDGEPVDEQRLDEIVARVRAASQHLPAPPSFFEATTAAALDLFRDARIDIAVLEVGLGGRLDATNAVEPVAMAITHIGLDHEQYLGSSRDVIAAEKAGILRAGRPVVVGENPDDVLTVIQRRASDVGASMIVAPRDVTADYVLDDGRARLNLTTPTRRYSDLRLGLRGRHQVQNAITAVRLLEVLDHSGTVHVPGDAIRTAVEHVTWPGRLELVRWGALDVLLDGAHNPSGAETLASYVREVHARPVPMVLGMMRDKDIDAILSPLLPLAEPAVFTWAGTDRAADPAVLRARADTRAPGLRAFVVPTPLEAVTVAGASGGPVVVAGSLFLVGAVRAELS